MDLVVKSIYPELYIKIRNRLSNAYFRFNTNKKENCLNETILFL